MAVMAFLIQTGIEVNTTILARIGSSSSEITVHAAAPAKAKTTLKKAANLPPKMLLKVVDQLDILPRQRDLADQVLRALPPECRNSLQSFYVLYNNKISNRGLGGESVIIVNGNVPDKEFMALLTHECGHVTDLGGLRGSIESGVSSFYDGNTPIFKDDPSVQFYKLSWITPTLNRPGSTEKDFVSGYAMSDPFEDFAETFAYYALQRKEFKRIAAKNPVLKSKYDFMEKVVFAGEQPVAVGKHVRGSSAPWDVTKLPYIWIAKI